MTEDDYAEFSKVWIAAHDLYPGKPASDLSVEIAYNSLIRFESADVSSAISAHISDPDAGVYAPKPADIVRKLQGASGDRALDAWAKVERTIRIIGPYQSVVFDDPAIHAVIDEMGGWIALCAMTTDERPFKQGEFRKRYQARVSRGIGRYASRLVGITEHQNGCGGHEIPDALVVGDPQRARLVHEGGVDRADRPVKLGSVLKRIERGGNEAK